jgi:flagellar biosynthesis protein FlhB
VVTAQAPSFANQWRILSRRALDAAAQGDLGNGLALLRWSVLPTEGVALALAAGWAAAMAAAFVQGGIVVAPAALTPDWGKLNPVSRVEQLFSLQALARALKSLLPVAVLVYLTVEILRRDWITLLTLSHRNVWGLARFTLSRLFEVAWKCALVMLLWGGVDYLIERQKLEGDLRMSRDELKQEFKDTEGNPVIKGRIRRLQRQMRKRRMLEEVKQAAVVITNPNEFAVALAYRPGLPAPTVVAKGRNLVARQIKEIARWQGIPTVENPPLAHALYRAVEVGQSIPPKLYAVVAGILAAIYRAQERASRAASNKGGR